MTMTETIDKHRVTISISVLVTVILFIITMTITFTNWTSSMEEKIVIIEQHLDAVDSHIAAIDDDIEDLEQRADTTDISNAKIETELVNIKALLLEIKQDLKDQRS